VYIGTNTTVLLFKRSSKELPRGNVFKGGLRQTLLIGLGSVVCVFSGGNPSNPVSGGIASHCRKNESKLNKSVFTVSEFHPAPSERLETIPRALFQRDRVKRFSNLASSHS